MIRRFSSVDERSGFGHDVELVMIRMCLDIQDEICKSRVLLFFLDANVIERVAINVCNSQGKEKHPKDYFQTNISY